MLTFGSDDSIRERLAHFMLGLMQSERLTLDKILDHAQRWHGAREIVTRSVEGAITRTTYAALHQRARRLSTALVDLGVQEGDRVATLAWNTDRHVEAWFAVMGIGAVCHTLNPRLFPEQIAWIINHAEDRIIFVDATFTPLLESILPLCPSVETVVIMSGTLDEAAIKTRPALHMQDLIDHAGAEVAWGAFSEETAAGLCYTSGTTGDPKGVLYSHRSNFLHTLSTIQPDVFALSARDVVMPVVPLFHANAWGLSFSCPAVGAKIVMPGGRLEGPMLYELLESEGVTVSAAVPTVWQTLLQHLRSTGERLTTLERVIIGGAAVPEAVVRGFRDDHGIDVLHAWGMTELSPLGTAASLTRDLAALPAEQQLGYQLKQGRPPIGIDLALVDDAGASLPHDGVTNGRLIVKGPWVARGYFRGAGGDILDEQGFFDTGDIATIDGHGFVEITDRAKDLIKSGGEWISSVQIENIAVSHPKAALAAVIAVPHPKWDERPLLLVKLKEGAVATPEEFRAFLDGKIAKWWLPDEILFVDDIPLGATGKINKRRLREQLADDEGARSR